MGLFNKKRKSEVTEVDVYTEHGNEVHVFDGPDGKVEVNKVYMADFLPTGDQWCITSEDAELFGGHPTKASSYD